MNRAGRRIISVLEVPMRGRVLVFALAVHSAAVVSAQPPRQTFEIASVKPRGELAPPPFRSRTEQGVFYRAGDNVESLVRFAYDLQNFQVSGGPDWIRTNRYEINAKAETTASREQMQLMLQSLLEDRFKLVAHQEPRDMRIYMLRFARTDRRLGPNLRKAASGCGTPGGPRGASLEERRTRNGGVSTRRTCVPIDALISSLVTTLNAPVDDGTALPGKWDYELAFTGEPRPGAAATDAPDPDAAPALFTAIQEQLGLELEPTRGPVDVLIIESVEQPTEN